MALLSAQHQCFAKYEIEYATSSITVEKQDELMV